MTNADFMSDDYRVNLDVFEGPLDLLIYLIKKNDLDVYDIPIAFVLEEYMRYLDSIKELNIDLAGEFLLMAAELAHIKSRMLLPDEGMEEDDSEIDPRSDLVRRLIEYQQFKEASIEFVNRSMLGRDVFVQQSVEKVECEEEGPVEGNVYELIEAFSKILERVPAENFHDVAVDRISVNERIYQIIGMLKKGVAVALEEVMPTEVTRYDIVVTFLALLEMCKLKMIKVYQSANFGGIHIQGIMEDVRDDEVAKLIELETSSFDAPKNADGGTKQ